MTAEIHEGVMKACENVATIGQSRILREKKVAGRIDPRGFIDQLIVESRI
jgi:hypothetical protein